MNNLKTVLIAGGTGSVGEGLVKTFLQNQWQVLVPGRTQAGLNNLAAFCNNDPNLKLHQADISKPESAEEFFRTCKEAYGSVDLLIVSVGGWRQGTDLVHLSWEEWQATINDNLSSHFLVMKYGFPLLQKDGVFVHINGMGAETIIPTAGPVVALAAAQLKLALTLAEEQKHSSKKVYELMLGLVNTRARNIRGETGEQLVNPGLVAKFILFLISNQSEESKKTLHKLKDARSVVQHL